MNIITSLRNWWQSLIAPQQTVVDVEARRQSKLLSSFIVIFLMFALLIYPLGILFNAYNPDFIYLTMLLIILSVWSIAYQNSKAGNIQRAAQLFTTSLTIGILAIVLISTEPGAATLANYLVLPILFSSLYLSRFFTYMLLTSSVITLTIGTLISDTRILEELPALYLMLATVIFITVIQHLKNIEHDRQASLRVSENRYRSLFETISDGIVVHHDGDIIDVNPAFEKLYDVKRKDMIGTSILQFVINDDQIDKWEHFQYQHNEPYEILTKTPQGKEIPVEIIGNSYADQDKQVHVVTIRDIAERSRIEQRRLELRLKEEQLKVMKRFVNNASHDLRTPMSVMQSSLYLLAKATTDERRTHYLNNLETQVNHMTQIITNLITMAKFDENPQLTRKPDDLNVIVAENLLEWQSSARRKNIEIHFQKDPHLPKALIDDESIKRVIDQLILNAVSHTPFGGQVFVRTFVEGQYAVFEVQDEGSGIDKETQKQIFERFYRGDAARNPATGGMGLGLTISKEIIDAHQGFIDVQSESDKGSLFRIRLPIAKQLDGCTT